MADNDTGLLSVKDFEEKGIVIDPTWTGLEALLAVATVASLKLEEEKITQAKGSTKKRPPVEGVSDANPIRVSRTGKLMREKPISSKKQEGKLLADAMKSSANVKLDYQNKLKRKCNSIEKVLNLNVPQKLKQLIEMLNGAELRLVIQKVLYATDVSNYHNRLSMPVNQIQNEFLTQPEKEILDRNGGKMEVLLIEPSLATCDIVLTKWVMPKSDKKGKSSCSYVLIKEWNNVKVRNRLEERDEIQLWSFRVNKERLYLALVLLPRGGGGGEVGDDGAESSQGRATEDDGGDSNNDQSPIGGIGILTTN